MNFFWPVYKNIEAEFIKIMYYIHIDDNQQFVYSSKMADLILRAAIEIESICKELYVRAGGHPVKNIKFDYDILDKKLIPDWELNKKVVIISSYNCFQTQKELSPFKKTEAKTGKPSELTFSWNNAYQNLKHDRSRSIQMGNIKYLFDIMAALFILNIYYKDESFPEAKFPNEISIPASLGSEIFSINIHTLVRTYGEECKGVINNDFLKAIYYIDGTEKTIEETCKGVWAFIENMYMNALQTPEIQNALKAMGNNMHLNLDDFEKILGKDKWNAIHRQSTKSARTAFQKSLYHAVLNKNNVKTYTPDITSIQRKIDDYVNKN